MMEATADAKLDERFRIVIPRDARNTAKLSTGDRVILQYRVEGRRIHLTIVPARLVPEDETESHGS